MRMILALALLAACGDGFSTAQSMGTIDAFETYLEENPNGTHRIEAEAQLETLYLEEARANPSLEAYDRYLKRWPKGVLREKAVEERERYLYEWAKENGKAPAWDRFLKEYPRANDKRLKEAKRRRAVAEYIEHLSWTDLVIEQVNLAENPDGPKDGWGFTMQVTNNGPKTIADLRFTIDYLDKHDRPIDTSEWPVVAERWPVPMEEEKKVPMKPGETRTWFWTTTPPDPKYWAGTARVSASRIRFVEG